MRREQLVYVTLRIGAAFTFLYPPLRAFSDPTSWLSYFPPFIRTLPINSLVLLHGFGVIEVVLALWILSGRHIRIPAALATLMLVAIVVFNWADLDIVFRDLSIAFMTLALVLWPERPLDAFNEVA
ncbi:DoxX family membrane protein [Patescibacteria group bacterium]|nr:DoxX family membrane protein [Patescibacteria group bacterium]